MSKTALLFQIMVSQMQSEAKRWIKYKFALPKGGFVNKERSLIFASCGVSQRLNTTSPSLNIKVCSASFDHGHPDSAGVQNMNEM